MHITSIEVLDLPPLDGFDFQCDERVNLFIGPNASGKSTILRAIMHLHPWHSVGGIYSSLIRSQRYL